MKALVALLVALGGFFLLLNTVGGVVSGIWLAILGAWWAIGLGFLLMFVATFLISIALLPMAAAGAGAYALRRSRTGVMLLALLSNLYLAAVMTAWSVGILVVFISRASESSWIPVLIWSYGVAMGPWAYMASKEQQAGGGEASGNAVMFAQVAYVVMVVSLLLGNLSVIAAAKVFGGVMVAYVVVNTIIAYSMLDAMEAESAEMEATMADEFGLSGDPE